MTATNYGISIIRSLALIRSRSVALANREDEIVYRILRRDIMPESTVYRSMQKETQAENSRAIALNSLRKGL
jgi:hypothetical protein